MPKNESYCSKIHVLMDYFIVLLGVMRINVLIPVRRSVNSLQMVLGFPQGSPLLFQLMELF